MKPIFYAALAVAMALIGPARAADYKILDRLKMADGYWDYGSSDLAKGLIYWVRSDHTDVIDTKTNKLSSLKNTGTGHMAVVVEGTSLGVIPLRTPPKMNAIVDLVADKMIAQV